MLVLSRKAGESIMIGDKITVTVLSIRAGAVRIGVNAPADQMIMRDELLRGAVTDSAAEIAQSVLPPPTQGE